MNFDDPVELSISFRFARAIDTHENGKQHKRVSGLSFISGIAN